jgi:hypothetical protein
MSIGSLNPLSNTYLQSILTSAIQGTGLTTNSANNSLSTSAASSITQAPDNSQLSPFAQLMSELQKLQQTDPAKYQQVTGQIATNLQTAAQTASAAGNTTQAAQLTQLSNDFSSASKSGQLPNMQDLAQAVGGHHHHHHHHAEPASTDPTSTSSTTSTSSPSQTLSQLLGAFQTNGAQSAATDPTSIIMSTLSSAGITGT